jgi:phospholipid/cholesterol/gamma-HCH transport system substrate-binding protein
VTLEVDSDVNLHRNAAARVANLGLLGEKYIELDPGSQDQPLVTENQIELRGTQPPTIDDVTNQVSAIATDVKAITESLRNTMGGPQGQQRLEDIVENVRAVTAQMRELLAANRANVDATVGNMRAITADLRIEIPKIAASIDRVAGQLGGTVGENREDVRHVVENLRQLSTDLKTTTTNLNSITGQMKSGEGTVGKLLYSDEAHERLTAALSSVESGVNELRNTLNRATRIQPERGRCAGYSEYDSIAARTAHDDSHAVRIHVQRSYRPCHAAAGTFGAAGSKVGGEYLPQHAGGCVAIHAQ